MGVGNYDRAARTAWTTGTRAGAARVSLWRQVTAGYGLDAVAVRYATLARVRAGRAGPAAFARSAREDVARLATALGAVLELHTPDRPHPHRRHRGFRLMLDEHVQLSAHPTPSRPYRTGAAASMDSRSDAP